MFGARTCKPITFIDMRYLHVALAVVSLVFMSSWLRAAAAELPAEFLRCSNEPDDRVRLRCFDQEVAKWRSTREKTIAPQVQAQPREPFPVRSESAAKVSETIPKIEAHLARVSTLANDRLSFELDNGQVWMQTEDKSGFRAAVGDSVTIKKGALGSVWLYVNKKWGTRVRRIH